MPRKILFVLENKLVIRVVFRLALRQIDRVGLIYYFEFNFSDMVSIN